MTQVYLVTGANKGIGYEAVRILSERLHEKDAVILLGTRSIENGKLALNKLQDSNPSHDYSNVHLIEIDVASNDSIMTAVEVVKSSYGSLHVLINNAGITGRHETPNQVFQVNVFGVYEMLSAFYPLMIPNSSQNIVVASEMGAWTLSQMKPDLQEVFNGFELLTQENLHSLAEDWKLENASQLSKYTWPDSAMPYGPYGTSKTMVIALTRKWAKEHPEINTVVVCPGYCATDLNDHTGPRHVSRGGESIVFPVFNQTETGGFYRDGIVHSFNTPRPAPEDYK